MGNFSILKPDFSKSKYVPSVLTIKQFSKLVFSNTSDPGSGLINEYDILIFVSNHANLEANLIVSYKSSSVSSGKPIIKLVSKNIPLLVIFFIFSLILSKFKFFFAIFCIRLDPLSNPTKMYTQLESDKSFIISSSIASIRPSHPYGKL